MLLICLFCYHAFVYFYTYFVLALLCTGEPTTAEGVVLDRGRVRCQIHLTLGDLR